MEDEEPKLIYPLNYSPSIKINHPDPNVRNQLLDEILKFASQEAVDTDIFSIMDKRRSTRKFTTRIVEDSKIDEILSAADTAPTAGNFQGFEIFHIKDTAKKEKLAVAANNQKFVNAPLVLVFCKNPSRVKFKFPEYILKKFAIQDATLAAGYAQLAAQALGLSSIWVGMFDEQKVMDVIHTDLTPSSILCIGYPQKQKYPKQRRNLKDLVHVVD